MSHHCCPHHPPPRRCRSRFSAAVAHSIPERYHPIASPTRFLRANIVPMSFCRADAVGAQRGGGVVIVIIVVRAGIVVLVRGRRREEEEDGG